MEFKQAFKKLNESKEFEDIRKKSEDTFFSYALKMLEENKEHPWQFGFYHKSTDKIFTFIVSKDNIEINKEEEIFKKPQTKVNPVDARPPNSTLFIVQRLYLTPFSFISSKIFPLLSPIVSTFSEVESLIVKNMSTMSCF